MLRKRDKNMTDKHIRASEQTWARLREAAFIHNSKIKTVIDDIISGKMNPITFEKNE
jgi:hypothetical protein